MVRVFANGPGDRGSIPVRVITKTQKWYWIPRCSTLGIVRYVSRVKWSYPGKLIVAFTPPRCIANVKGAFGSPSTTVTNVTFMCGVSNGPLTKWVEGSPMAWETVIQSYVESYQRLKKWHLMHPCLTLSNIRYVSRGKWSNPGKGVEPSPTPWCSSYWKGSLQAPLTTTILSYC